MWNIRRNAERVTPNAERVKEFKMLLEINDCLNEKSVTRLALRVQRKNVIQKNRTVRREDDSRIDVEL